MDVKATLKPGQPGTKKLHDHFGDRLVCVRYRYDKAKRRRFKTVEIIVDETLWEGETIRRSFGRFEPQPMGQVLIRIDFNEYELRGEIKRRGAIWQPKERLWRVHYEDVVDLGLRPRIVRFLGDGQDGGGVADV